MRKFTARNQKQLATFIEAIKKKIVPDTRDPDQIQPFKQKICGD